MFKKIITSTLVLVMLSTSSVVVYADPMDKPYIEEARQQIKIISPQISPDNEVISEKNLLISIKVLGEESVTLSVYDGSGEPVIDHEEIDPKDDLESDYVKYVKNIEAGDYRMVFEKDGEEEPIEDIEFQVKKAEEVVNEEKEDSLPNLLDLSITNLLLGQ